MFQVFDNDRPARHPDCDVSPSWKTHEFETFKEAYEYALNWLGPYGKGITLMLDKPFPYSGYGDVIEIREKK